MTHRSLRRFAGRWTVLLAALALLGANAQAGGKATAQGTAGDAGSAGGSAAALASANLPATAVAPVADAFDPSAVTLGLDLVKSGFSSPVLVTHAGDGSGRLFVVEQSGKIRIIDNGTTLATPFLDLEGAITFNGERGLLGLAFNPLFPTRPYFYVDFVDRNGNTAINRYTVGSDPNVAIRSSGVRVMTIGQPNYPNHKGGNLAFGPDGYLYIGMGDGGSGGDPGNRAQSLNSLLGKMLRINVDKGSSLGHYAVPATNPYVGKAGFDQIWSRGLRNPWRWSFDRVTHQLWIADVGQDRYEEVNRSSPSGSTPAGRAVNYGWRVLEANTCYLPSSGCSTSGKQAPVAAYAHVVTGEDNCAVTGGYVYRGAAYPALVGGYVFGDFCSGRVWVMSATAAAPVNETLVLDTTLNISSFGEDEAGELYLCDLGGSIYRITAAPKS